MRSSAAPQAEVDGDLELLASHDLPDALQAHAFSEHTPLDETLLAKGDAHLVLVDPGRRLAEGHHDPAPVGSAPLIAALTSGELATARAAISASRRLAAPRTVTATSLVAPRRR